jgi:hypothetical protein
MSLLLLFKSSGGGVTYETLTPDADVSDGGWTTQAGGTVLYAVIDEAAADDADYIRSSDDPSADACEVSLSNPTGNVGEEVIVEYRYAKSGTAQINLVVTLKQGVTTIATWTHNNIGTTETTAQQTLSAGEVASITDYSALSLRFEATEA